MKEFPGSVGNSSVLEQELRGIEHGLRLALEIRVRKKQIDYDSKMAVNIISDVTECPWFLHNLCRGIKYLLNLFAQWTISHIFRETNRAADWLASRGGDLENSYSTFSQPLKLEFTNIVCDEKFVRWYTKF